MNRVFSLLIAATCLTALFSCQKIIGNGPVEIENRPAGNFTTVASSISADVYYIQAPEYQVKVSAQQNVLNVIETYTSGNELIIKHRNGVILGSRDRIKIEVRSPEIHGLRVSGSGKIFAMDTVRSSDIMLTVSGSGGIDFQNLVAHTVTAKVSGSGNILVSGGVAEQVNLTISGSGDINTFNLPATVVTTNTSGSGRMRVHALEKLNVTISGSGCVWYTGNPQVNSKISGSGKVVKQ